LPGFQTRFLQRGEFESLGGGAAGPGKTAALIIDAARDACHGWYRGLFTRRTLPELRDVIRKMQDLYPKLYPGAWYKESEKRWIFPAGGSLQMAYCENYTDATAHQGAEYTALFCDEVGLLADEGAYTFLVSRVRSAVPEAQKHLRVRCSANPAGLGHAWVKRRFVDTTQKGKRVYEDVGESGYTLTRSFVPGRLIENPYLPKNYIAQLDGLPEVLRRAIRDGDWDVGLSSAFSDLDSRVHFVPPFDVPDGWQQWGSHDWGFAHWAVTCHFAQAHDTGEKYLIDTVWCRRLLPDQIAERVWEQLPVPALTITYAGHDCWAEHRARGDNTPTIAAQYLAKDWVVAQANIARIAGYQHLANMLGWRGRAPDGSDITPQLRFCDTPGNRRVFAQLEVLILDPDNPRDVLKVDADMVTGGGGDDGYDCLRYGMASHQHQTETPEEEKTAWSPEMLAAQAERQARHTSQWKPPAHREGAEEGYDVL